MKQSMSLKKRTLLQDLLVLLFTGAALFSVLLTVLSLIPEPAGLTVREEVIATAARISAEDAVWTVEVRGRLRNTAGHAVTAECITVTVKGSPDVVLKTAAPLTLQPREDYDLMLTVTSDRAAEGIPEITALVDGREVYLRNPADTPLAATLVPLTLAVLFGILAWRAVRVRIYLHEEAKIKQG